MKKILPLALLFSASTAFASNIQFDSLTKQEVKDISREFSANFAHTGVSAPETNGLWGVEVGIIGGQASSPDLAKTVERSGGKKSDFEKLYHAGIQARVHLPLEIFAEAVILPEQEFSDIKIKNTSFEIGWNAGSFFGLPLDLAIAANRGNSAINFTQDLGSGNSKVELESQTTMLWVGVSKKFLFVTPYAKLGTVSSDSDLSGSADIFDMTFTGTKQSAKNSGSYMAAGVNLEFGFIKLGAEYSRVMDVNRATAKFSIDI